MSTPITARAAPPTTPQGTVAATPPRRAPARRIPRVLRDNGLSIVLTLFFLSFWAAQVASGHRVYNEEQLKDGGQPVGLAAYLHTGHFLEATGENWESEFLQMSAYVLLSVGLFQKGSSQSKDPEGPKEAVDRDPRLSNDKAAAPWPVRRGGWLLRVYENSLSLAFLFMFFVAFGMHGIGGAMAHNAEAAVAGGAQLSVAQYMESAQFWFESFQNWQSEFLAIVAMVFLSIYLRQRGSPESKPVDAPHSQTGTE